MSGSVCRRCGRPLVWVINVRTGHRMPVDPDPCREGTVTIEGTARSWDGTRYARVHATPEVAAMTGLDRPRFRPHTATCPKTKPKTRRPTTSTARR